MNYKESYDLIYNYKVTCEQERKDKELTLWLLDTFKEKAYTRELKIGHITSSAIVVDENCEYILMAYHNIYKSWAWLGGHADGEFDLEKLARREVNEETGANHLKLIDQDISSLEVLTVEPHIKRGEYISSHLHFNVTYTYICSLDEKTRIKADENSKVGWIKIDDLYEYVKNDHEMYTIYMKSINRIRKKVLFQ